MEEEKPEVEFINKFMVKFTALTVPIVLFSFKDYRQRSRRFHSDYMNFLYETKRLDNYLDKKSGKMSSKLSYFKKEISRLLKQEKIPKKFYLRVKLLADGVCSDYAMLHMRKTKGPLDILKKKADNSTKLVLMAAVAKTFPEAELGSRRLNFMLKMSVLYGRVMGFIDDIVDIIEDKGTPHLNSFLTAVGYGKS